MNMLKPAGHAPSILEVITDLSNDEVFTPPKVANAVLDLLPDHVWTDPNLRWLDVGAKTGVFLREVTRRLMVGLTDEISDDQRRLDHILHNMVYGIAITELTSLMSRRTVYCSKHANSEYSVVAMPTEEGNVWFARVEHSYKKGRCTECGASESQMERDNRENHAYAFIHAAGRKAFEKEYGMKFDVIVGNPPYQMDDVGGHRPVPIYNLFVEQAIALGPRYICMITPSRWVAGGLGLSDYRAKMLSDTRLRHLVDFPVASELFAGVEIKGGVSYFLWDREWSGECSTTLRRGDVTVGPTVRRLDEHDVLVRDPRALPILAKSRPASAKSFAALVASVRPFGDKLRSNFRDYHDSRTSKATLRLYMNDKHQRVQRWVDDEFVTNNQLLAQGWKVYLPKAGSDGGQRLPDTVIGKAFVGEPNSVCTETYLAIGPFDSEAEASSALAYLQTRFARFLISLRKPGQDNVPSTFDWVPQQSWDRAWTDAELFKKYGVTADEQAFIAEMVREMSV